MTRSVTERLRTIWLEHLPTGHVGDTDNFVELGGDSIAATVCTTAVSVEFGIEVPVAALLLEDANFTTFVADVERLIPDGM